MKYFFDSAKKTIINYSADIILFVILFIAMKFILETYDVNLRETKKELEEHIITVEGLDNLSASNNPEMTLQDESVADSRAGQLDDKYQYGSMPEVAGAPAPDADINTKRNWCYSKSDNVTDCINQDECIHITYNRPQISLTGKCVHGGKGGPTFLSEETGYSDDNIDNSLTSIKFDSNNDFYYYSSKDSNEIKCSGVGCDTHTISSDGTNVQNTISELATNKSFNKFN